MGIYYHLTNDTKKHKVHLADHVKIGPLTMNEAVHYALVNYMMENQYDILRMLPDTYGINGDYENIDLLKYPFNDTQVIKKIVEKLNLIYGNEKFKVIDGMGIEGR